MILHPAIIALILASLLISGMVLYSSIFGIQIIRRWDRLSGSEEQLSLERRTYLISTLLTYALAFQVGSLFLYIYTADSIHSQFVGAMCAAGTLNVNPYGYPTFLLKILNFVLAGLWLIVNNADNRAFDYPLIRKKYAMLLVLAPLIVAESVLQVLYFSGLKGDVITSCCGSLFGADKNTVSSEIASMPVKLSLVLFYTGIAVTLSLGVIYRFTKRLGYLFSVASGALFLISSVSLISFISLYFYEMPTHHCPFCILQREYGYIGYLLYITLLAGVVSGLGVGVLMPLRCVESLSRVLPVVQRHLASLCLVSYLLFAVTATYRIISTDFTLGLW